IRGRILRAFEEAERNPELADEFLTFVIVGAGPTGVEMAGSVAEIAVHALGSDFRNIDPASARVLLVEGSPQVLPVYPETLSAKAQRQLEDLGVEVRTDSLVTDIDAMGVTLASGDRVPARTVVWAAGVQASSLGAALPGERDRAGRVLVAEDLSVPDHPRVFVAGDLAAISTDGSPVPGVAPAAMQQGRHVARQVLADLAGEARTPFRYRDKGSLATIGRARAVADLGRFRFGGPLAWVAWLAIHIVYLVGFRNRVFVVSQWAWQYATFRRGARIITDAVRRGRR
ncbi:MAG: NAD(P)/FAD-dependent oxidoreductase, partial [Acidimicrobiia bacterium]|nr:NAD(P)/FAD-dependent oxidoreductase [Acidimicrobiia bacterium]